MLQNKLPIPSEQLLRDVSERDLWPYFWEAVPDMLVEPLPNTKIGIAHISRLDYPPEDHIYPIMRGTHVITLNLMDIPEVELEVDGVRWDRPIPGGAVTILPAHAYMHLKIRTNYNCLSFYIPDQLIHQMSRDAGVIIDSRSPISPVVFDEKLHCLGNETYESLRSARCRLDVFQAEMTAKAFASRILRHFFIVANDAEKKGGLAPHILRRVTMQIQDNLATPPSLSDLAEDAGVSTFHLCRAFRQSMGTTISAFIANKRIERAQYLLVNTSMPIGAIATDSGYHSPSHFAQMFRREVGMSPREFRRR